jgi:hypothetical protein
VAPRLPRVDQVGDRPQLLARRQSVTRLGGHARLEFGYDRFQPVGKVQGIGVAGRGRIAGTPGDRSDLVCGLFF